MRHEGDGVEGPSLCDGFTGCGLHGTLFSTLYSKSNYLDRLLPCLWNSMFSQPLWLLLYYFFPHNYESSFFSPIDSCIMARGAYWTAVIDLCWALFPFLSPQKKGLWGGWCYHSTKRDAVRKKRLGSRAEYRWWPSLFFKIIFPFPFSVSLTFYYQQLQRLLEDSRPQLELLQAQASFPERVNHAGPISELQNNWLALHKQLEHELQRTQEMQVSYKRFGSNTRLIQALGFEVLNLTVWDLLHSWYSYDFFTYVTLFNFC